jgi:DME family drug/metabolite transporter
MEADTTGWQMLSWRSLAFAALMLALAMRRAGSLPRLFDNLRALGWLSVPIALTVGLGQAGYLLGMINTTVANVAFLLGTAPLLTAVGAWALFGEKLSRRGMFALTAAMVGIAIMFGEGLEGGHLLGVACAVVALVTYVGYILMLRRARDIDTFLASGLGGLLGAAIAMTMAGGDLAIADKDMALSLGSGAFQVGAGFTFATLAVRHLKAAEVTLLVLIESILGPLFTWLLIAEAPAPQALVGGGVVLISVAAYLWLSLREAAE